MEDSEVIHSNSLKKLVTNKAALSAARSPKIAI
jgi:hypothetical protein